MFGQVSEGVVVLSNLGRVVRACLEEAPRHYAGVRLDAFVVMPNHVHAVFLFDERVVARRRRVGLSPTPTPEPAGEGTGQEAAPRRTEGLPHLVGSFKSFSTRGIRSILRDREFRVWQRGYYERVIRHEEELNAVRQYVIDNPNPRRWEEDEENPEGLGVLARVGGGPALPLGQS